MLEKYIKCRTFQGVAFLLVATLYNRHQEQNIPSLLFHGALFQLAQINQEISPKLDLSIEGMRSQQFSEWVFVFLMFGIMVFAGILIALLFGKNGPKQMKPGERMMFGAIILGVVAAVLFGAMQMLGGYLF